MKDYYADIKFRRLLAWLEDNGGRGYGCIEIASEEEKDDFILALKKYLSKPIKEVNFSINAREIGYEDYELIVPAYQFQTIQNFRDKYGADHILIFTNLQKNINDHEYDLILLLSDINKNRENYIRYPSVILFIFPKWFMDILFQKAHDFISALGFHEDFVTLQSEDAFFKNNFNRHKEIFYSSSEFLKSSYEETMKDFDLPLEMRLSAAAKFINSCTTKNADEFSTISFAESLEHESVPVSENEILAKSELEYQLGIYYMDIIGNYDKSYTFLENSLKYRSSVLGNTHLQIADNYETLGKLFYKNSEFQRALEYDKLALEIREKSGGIANKAALAKNYNDIGTDYSRMQNYCQALLLHQTALKLRLEFFGSEHPDTAQSYNNIGIEYSHLGKHDEAIRLMNTALEIRKRLPKGFLNDLAQSYETLGTEYHVLGEYEKAVQYLKESIRIRRQILGESHPDIAWDYSVLGMEYNCLGEYSNAYQYIQKAWLIQKESLGDENPDTLESKKELERLEKKMSSEK